MCQLKPKYPGARCPDGQAARTAASTPRSGLHSDGVLLFDNTGEPLPNAEIVPPHRALRAAAA